MNPASSRSAGEEPLKSAVRSFLSITFLNPNSSKWGRATELFSVMMRTGTSSHSEDSAKLGRFRVEMLLGFTASACLKGTYKFTWPVLAAAMCKMRGARSTARFGTASTDLTGTLPNIACARGARTREAAVHATPPKRCDFSEQRRRIQRKTTRPGDARARRARAAAT